MAKELYIYSNIYDFVAEEFIAQLEEYQGEDVTIRVCSPGGNVFAAWGMIAKMQEHTGKMKIKCDGLAASMILYMLVFCEDVECLDSTEFVLHRADTYVSTPEDQALLNSVNDKLKEKLTAKIDSKKLKEITGYSIKDIFNPDTDRLDVRLNAKQAKEIGLVNKVNKLTPAIAAELKSFYNRFNIAATHNSESTTTQKKPIKMNIEKFKAEHPDVYAEVFNLGVAQEKDRVEACLVFNEIDPKTVMAAISSGKPLSQKQIAELSLKALSKDKVEAIKTDSEGSVVTEEVVTAKTEKDLKLQQFEKSIDASLKIKTVK